MKKHIWAGKLSFGLASLIKWNLLTFNSPVVIVPVFETHKSCSIAQVYTASRFFIKILSFLSLFIERAMAIEMANGMPSGRAIIKIVRPKIVI